MTDDPTEAFIAMDRTSIPARDIRLGRYRSTKSIAFLDVLRIEPSAGERLRITFRWLHKAQDTTNSTALNQPWFMQPVPFVIAEDLLDDNPD